MLCETKVGEFDSQRTPARDQDVGRFNVSMDETLIYVRFILVF